MQVVILHGICMHVRGTDMPPLKPDFRVDGQMIWVFMGADYKIMDIETCDKHIRKLQAALALARHNRIEDQSDANRT